MGKASLRMKTKTEERRTELNGDRVLNTLLVQLDPTVPEARHPRTFSYRSQCVLLKLAGVGILSLVTKRVLTVALKLLRFKYHLRNT